jgi:histidyl-tRNA synthetase
LSDTSRIEARKLKGFRDYDAHACQKREEITRKLRAVAAQSGFQEIATPVLEYQEVLLGAGGDETDKEVYRFVDHGDRAVALRFDLTVPFARYVAEHQGTMVFPFKKLQIGDVWRGEKPQKGRYRQFCQGDLDIIGVDSLAADVEVVGCIFQVLDDVVPSSFTLSIGNRVVLNGIIRTFAPQATPEEQAKILIALDKLKKIGHDKTVQMICDAAKISDEQARKLLSAVVPSADGKQDWDKLAAIVGEGATVELRRYRQTIELLQEICTGARLGKVRADLSLARGLSYYTGIVFEATVDAMQEIGSISGGGRYNELVSRFSSRELAGVGGSVGVDRVLACFESLNQGVAHVRRGIMIAVATEDALSYGFSILSQLRTASAGLTCDIGLQIGKLGSQFKYADRMSYAQVVIVGTDERASNTVAVKDLTTGQEKKSLPRDELVRHLGL